MAVVVFGGQLAAGEHLHVEVEERAHEVEVAGGEHRPVGMAGVLEPVAAAPGPVIGVKPVVHDEDGAIELDRERAAAAAGVHEALKRIGAGEALCRRKAGIGVLRQWFPVEVEQLATAGVNGRGDMLPLVGLEAVGGDDGAFAGNPAEGEPGIGVEGKPVGFAGGAFVENAAGFTRSGLDPGGQRAGGRQGGVRALDGGSRHRARSGGQRGDLGGGERPADHLRTGDFAAEPAGARGVHAQPPRMAVDRERHALGSLGFLDKDPAPVPKLLPPGQMRLPTALHGDSFHGIRLLFQAGQPGFRRVRDAGQRMDAQRDCGGRLGRFQLGRRNGEEIVSAQDGAAGSVEDWILFR